MSFFGKLGGFVHKVLGIANANKALLGLVPFGNIISIFISTASAIDEALSTPTPGETKAAHWIDAIGAQEEEIFAAVQAVAKPGASINRNSAEYADMFAKGRDFAVALGKLTGHVVPTVIKSGHIIAGTLSAESITMSVPVPVPATEAAPEPSFPPPPTA